jgi:spermidine/putrescine transport system permease protein
MANHVGRVQSGVGRSRRISVGRLLGAPDIAFAAIGFVAPLAVLVAYSFGKADSLTQDVSITGTLKPYRLLFSDLYRPVFVRSAGLALASLGLCICFGIPAALAISRFRATAQRWLIVLMLFPSFVSFTVRIYAWAGILGNKGPVANVSKLIFGHPIVLLFRPGSLLIGMLTAYLPLFVLPVLTSLQQVDALLLETAADLGAGSGRVTRKIVLPLAAPGIITGATLVSILALGEFLIPTVLGGGKVLLLGTLLAEQAGGRNKPLGGAIATTLLLTMLLLAFIGTLLQRWTTRRVGTPTRAGTAGVEK